MKESQELLAKAFAEGRVSSNAVCCFLEQCVRKNECLRYQLWVCLRQKWAEGKAVFPDAETDDACPFFAPLRTVRMAWGFNALFRDVRINDGKELRAQMREILGSKRQYYSYKLGQRKLLPEQQDEIKRLFAEYGYADADFDHFSYGIDLSRLLA